MKIDIWSDIVCPYCYVGTRRLKAAIAQFEHADELEVRWHSFELDRSAEPVSGLPLVDLVASKYGISLQQAVDQHRAIADAAAQLGLEFNWEQARYGNTFDAHRLAHLAADHGLADEAHERLMRAYFTDGLAVGDRETLVRLGVEIGVAEALVRDMLESEDDFGNHVRSDEATAKMLGIESVPFVVLDRKYGVSGAQPVEVFAEALRTAWAERHETPEPVGVGSGCGSGCGAGGCGGVCGR